MTTLSPPRPASLRVRPVAVSHAEDRDRRSTAPPARPSRGRATAAEVLAEAALVCVALSASLGVARLMHGGLGHAVLLPLFASVGAGAVATALFARTKLNLAAVTALGIVVTALVTVWSVAPSATRFGLPVITTFHVLSKEISNARAVMGTYKTPVPSAPGVVLIASLSAGVVAVAARAIWELARRSSRHWSKLLAIIPTLAMFCYAAPLSARIDRPEITIVFFSSVLLFVAASDATGRTMLHVGEYSRGRAAMAAIVPGVTTAVTALLVLLLAAAALAGTNPLPFPWWSAQSGPGGYTVPGNHKGGLTALSLVANLRGDETTQGTEQMFTADTPVPTYWQVGTLSVFDGSSWQPNEAEKSAFDGGNPGPVPPTPVEPFPEDEFVAKVSLDHFTTRLLPVPPLANAIVSGSGGVQSATVVEGLGVTVSNLVGSGQSYSVTSGITTTPSLSSDTGPLSFIDNGLGDSYGEFLALPSGIPPEVTTMARAAVAGATTPLEMVQALVNYFRSGAFIYTLNPPAVPPRQNPLMWFLTDHQGFCQQFAGAFGVMARELKIPVRLAVGFTLGHSLGHDTYSVTGADAHVWPEVYMGEGLGWVSVDPTPGGPEFNEPNVASVMGVRAIPTVGGSKGNRGPNPKLHNRITHPTAPRDAAGTAQPSVVHHKKQTPFPGGLVVGGVLVLLVVCGLAFYLRRSRRSARGGLVFRHSGDPDHTVIRSWQRAADALGRAGFKRSVSTTPIAHAAAIREAVISESKLIGKRAESLAALGTATYGYTELAEMAEIACYSPGHCSDRDARVAEQEAWRIERALRSAGMFRRFPTQFAIPEPAG